MNAVTPHNLWLRLFLPFAAGYFLSYLYRTVNAVIGPLLAGELALGDNALGLLTSTYFLAFGAAQLPLGMLLDHYGPRRVESVLLLIASAGTAVFALADGLGTLALGRALIGLGVSACLMASLKAFAQWYPPEKLASMTGWIMTAGGLGALAASQPLELALGLGGWRAICLGLAAATLVVALMLWWLAPDKPAAGQTPGLAAQMAGVRHVFASRLFWRYVPMAFWLTGGFMAVQGLWVSRWMAVLEGLDRAAIAQRLSLINGAMLAGFLFMGFFATRLVRRGVSLDKVYLGACLVSICALAMICVWPGTAGGLLWPMLGFCFALSNIAYSRVTAVFPAVYAGRANTALNLLVFAGAFLLQWGTGLVVDSLQAAGWTVAQAYRISFVVLLAGQVLALLWLLRPQPR